ncbi:hypothetical protein V2P20_09210 [Methylobacter sp. Wu1]|uniref:hypothetical protein n=1 Tax=Methylobacter sp. Wu1 TaxID=3119359 RepID=UPI002F95EDAA
MTEKLTKTAIKEELVRRIAWFEKAYGFSEETTMEGIKSKENHHLSAAFGRYVALKEIRWQIDNRLFIGGFTC